MSTISPPSPHPPHLRTRSIPFPSPSPTNHNNLQTPQKRSVVGVVDGRGGAMERRWWRRKLFSLTTSRCFPRGWGWLRAVGVVVGQGSGEFFLWGRGVRGWGGLRRQLLFSAPPPTSYITCCRRSKTTTTTSHTPQQHPTPPHNECSMWQEGERNGLLLYYVILYSTHTPQKHPTPHHPMNDAHAVRWGRTAFATSFSPSGPCRVSFFAPFPALVFVLECAET